MSGRRGAYECHARCGDHAALAHGEAGNDGEGEHGDDDLLRQDVVEVGREGLAQIALEHRRDVHDCVGDDELQEPAERAAHCGSEEDGAGRGDVGVAAFFCEVEGRVIAAHCPCGHVSGFVRRAKPWEADRLQMTDTNDMRTETPGAKSVPS